MECSSKNIFKEYTRCCDEDDCNRNVTNDMNEILRRLSRGKIHHLLSNNSVGKTHQMSVSITSSSKFC